MPTVYLDLDHELLEALNASGTTIANILAQAGIDAETNYGVLPSDDENTARSKDIATIILASGVSISAIVIALSHAFRSFVRRPHVIEVEELEELRDIKGNLLLDKKGQPIYKTTRRQQILEPQKADSQTELEANISLTGAVVKFKTSESQRDQPAETK